MNTSDIWTLVFLIILIIYSALLGKFLQSRGERSFYRSMAIMAPGLLLLLAIFGWLALGFSPKVIIGLSAATVVYIIIFVVFLQNFANWLSKFPSVQSWRKNFLRNRIMKQQKKGRSARDIQARGLIPDTEKLKEFGFSESELREFGLLE